MFLKNIVWGGRVEDFVCLAKADKANLGQGVFLSCHMCLAKKGPHERLDLLQSNSFKSND